MSEHRLSKGDLAKAAALNPLDPFVLRLQLARGSATTRQETARRILWSSSGDLSLTLSAIAALGDAGYEVLTKLAITAGRVVGWMVWKGRGDILVDGSPSGTIVVSRDGDHRLSVDGWSAVDIDWPETLEAFGVSAPNRRPLRRLSIPARGAPVAHAAPAPRSAPASDGPGRITVIVPLYDEPRLTTLCLGLLARQTIESVAIRVVLVLDNSDHSGMIAVAERAVARHGFELLKNPRTLGFAGAVNRGLAVSGTDDVLLLNSDVLLPSGALHRLRLAALAAPDIGTVTPLSNNGEEASFPAATSPNAMGSTRAIAAIDSVAASIAAEPVTLPNGIGFCLYLRRQLLDRVGPMPEIYDRGYYEDVEICLLGAAAGLRNICAPNVYVGHKGSSSFKDEKRGLVVRNRKIIESRFPTYRATSAAFSVADPLKPARRAIEFLTGPAHPCDRLVLVPPGVPRSRLASLPLREMRTALFAGWSHAALDHIDVFALDGRNPQSLRFNGSEGRERLTDYLEQAAIRKLVLLGPCLEQRGLIEHLHLGGMEIEIVCDESLLQLNSAPRGTGCDIQESDSPCAICIGAFKTAMHAVPNASSARRDALGTAMKRARLVRPTNAMASAMVDRLGLGWTVSGSVSRHVRPAVGREPRRGKLGILVPRAAGQIDRLVDTLLHDDLAIARSREMVVLGKTLDDLCLMSSGRAFVSGETTTEELADMARIYQIDALFAPSRWSGYGDLERLGLGLPWAYFDWSGGALRRRDGDLDLDPRLCDRKVAFQIERWMLESVPHSRARA